MAYLGKTTWKKSVLVFLLLLFAPSLLQAQQKNPLIEKYKKQMIRAVENKTISLEEHPSQRDISLSSRSVPLVRHQPGSSSVIFKKSAKLNPNSFFRKVGISKQWREQQGKRMLKRLEKRLSRLLTLPELPGCRSSRSYGKQVFHNTAGSSAFDYYFFNPEDPKQAETAKSFGPKAVAYYGGRPVDMFNKSGDPRPAIAAISNVRCLPTRVHFTDNGPRRFLSYEEGNRRSE